MQEPIDVVEREPLSYATGMSDWPSPPYRIETERLLLRCYDPGDAGRVRDVVVRDREYLVEWMPWALQEPQTLEEKRELLRRFRANFDQGLEFAYGIFTPDDAEFLGSCGLHPRCGAGGLEIGYWIRSDRAGLGYATEATVGLAQAGFGVLGADRLEIRVDPDNGKSLAIPERLGFEREALLRRRLHWPGREPRDLTIWTLFRSDFASSPCAAPRAALYDALGLLMRRPFLEETR